MSTPPPPSPTAPEPSDEGLAALERLRKRVEAAAAEIERLRTENAALAERVRELAAHDVARGDGGAGLSLTLEGDPSALRKKVEGFIEAIDQMLAAPGEDAPTDSTA